MSDSQIALALIVTIDASALAYAVWMVYTAIKTRDEL